MTRYLRLFIIVLSFSLCHAAWGKRFRNAYVSFELPPNWNCKLEGAEWVCENDYSKKQKEAIIILTAKEVGPSDTLSAYMTQLESPRTLPDSKTGAPTRSKVIHVQQRTIANQLWVDGMHEGSEVAAYFTRYMATIKDRIAILVTFSAHKEHYSKYANDFRTAIESLRVVASKDLLGPGSQNDLAGSDANIHGRIGGNFGSGPDNIIDNNPYTGPVHHRSFTKLLLFALVLGAAGGYLYWQSKKTPPKKRK